MIDTVQFTPTSPWLPRLPRYRVFTRSSKLQQTSSISTCIL